MAQRGRRPKCKRCRHPAAGHGEADGCLTCSTCREYVDPRPAPAPKEKKPQPAETGAAAKRQQAAQPGSAGKAAQQGRCGRCKHRSRDHRGSGRACLVCFTCKTFVDTAKPRSRAAKCKCMHSSRRHVEGGRCQEQYCVCAAFRPLVVKSLEEKSTSVRTVSAGGFESNRRRH